MSETIRIKLRGYEKNQVSLQQKKEKGGAVESVIHDVYDHSTAEELVMSDDFVDGQNGNDVCSRDVVFETELR